MFVMKCLLPGVLFAMALLFSQTLLALDIQAQGLLKGAAVLTIDGRQQLLKVGNRSPEGVLLVSADPKQAMIEIDGQRHTLTLSRHITSNYNPTLAATEVSIRRNNFNQYITDARLNGRRLSVLVDTGANAIALNTGDAQRIGLDYKSGTQTKVQTASGLADAYMVKLRSVNVGGINVDNVDGFVIDGDFPQMVLLGMSFLEHVDLREEGGILYLKGKH